MCMSYAQSGGQVSRFDFYDHPFTLNTDPSVLVNFSARISEQSITEFYKKINSGNYKTITDSLVSYREKYQLNDWIYYQLIRKVAQQISPKAEIMNDTLYINGFSWPNQDMMLRWEFPVTSYCFM